MILSMTGYGAAQREDSDLSLSTEVRAVNQRYLKTTYRTPEFLGALESEFDRIIRAKISRGALTVTMRCRRLGTSAELPISMAMLEAYATHLPQIAARLGLKSDLSIADLVALPGVVEEDPQATALDPIRERVLASLVAALDDFQAMRRQEGKTLEADLRLHLKIIREHLAEINGLAPAVVEEYRDRLLARVALLLKGTPLDMARETLLTEVSLFAERSDINEEIARLQSHLGQFDELLESDQPAGRKLEFLTQEMLREANTIGSKSGHAQISRRIVEIKATIDRLKEQVQNAE